MPQWVWLVVVVFIIFAIAGAPGWGPWRHDYGYAPTGIGTLIAVILIAWLLLGGPR